MSRRLLPSLAALSVAGLLASCGGDESAASGGASSGAPRNLILISVDTLRADHLGCYGYERETSPAIDALAEQGVVFENCLSTTGWTIPSHVSMLSGLYPRNHGVDGWEKRIPDDVPVLEVYNKIDRIDGCEPHVERDEDGRVSRVWLSALDGAGTHLLLDAVGEAVNAAKQRRWLRIEAGGGRLRALLYNWGAVVDEVELPAGGWELEVTLADARWQALVREPGFERTTTVIERGGSLPQMAGTAADEPA